MGAFLHTESHDGNPEGLRHAHLGRVLRGSVPASGRLPESEGCDAEGELSVLRGSRGDDPAPGRAAQAAGRHVRVRGDAGPRPGRDRDLRGDPRQDEADAELPLRERRRPRGDARVRDGGRGGETMERFTDLVTEMQKRGAPAKAANRELVIVRVLDAPRALVWKAWTEPERLKRWWGPRTFTTPVAKIDLRVGGAFLYCMRQPDGKDIWGTGVYREIVPLKRIVYTDSFADEKGNVVPATYYGLSRAFPLEMQVTVTFEDHDGKTKITLHHVGIPASPDRDGANQGWNESLDKLAATLAA